MGYASLNIEAFRMAMDHSWLLNKKIRALALISNENIGVYTQEGVESCHFLLDLLLD